MDWLQTWDPKTVAAHRPHAGKRLDHTGSDQFPEREIDAGDRIFVGYVGDGHPECKHHRYLIGSLIVEAPGKLGLPEADRGWLTRREAESYLGTTDIWDARAHVIARRRALRRCASGLRCRTRAATADILGPQSEPLGPHLPEAQPRPDAGRPDRSARTPS